MTTLSAGPDTSAFNNSLNAADIDARVAALESTIAGFASLAGSAAVGFLPGTGLTVRTVQAKLRERVSIADFGAVGDGTTDDTAAVASAVAFALDNNIRHLFVPAGVYRLTAPITISGSLWLDGDGVEPNEGFSPGPGPNPRGGGSWFFLDHPGKGFILQRVSLGNSASGISVSWLGTFRTHTVGGPGMPFTPTVYDYDFTVDDADALFDNVTLLNAYNGIQVLNGNAGRLTTVNLRGQPLNIGILIDQAYDVVRISDTHFWPFWSQSEEVAKYQINNSRAIVSARNDNPLIVNLFCIFYKIGLHIVGNSFGTTNKLKLVNADFDRGQYGIYVEPSATGHTGMYTNVTAQGEVGSLATFTANNSGVAVNANNCVMNFAGLDLAEHRGASLDANAANVELNISQLQAGNWNGSGLGFGCVQAAAGAVIEISDRPKFFGGGGAAVFSGAGEITVPMRTGISIANTNGAGDVIVMHNCPITPRKIFVTPSVSVGLIYTVRAREATSFTVRFFDSAGAPWLSKEVKFDWKAEY
ncbi:hypothetical protein IEQ11_20095 [Lysobacter capsici]|uniref:glycosyl hydrolase family 28-related protein n=1 Tax=Lysobacter capsici TaxID=435897 RepID=UPI00071645D8|nr:glycosyl hydrolase family 28-related protein [Lysobacter capsici]UOF14005.1 hypothetical protein IEQ11_20095 [Lysobacter capsici]